MATPIVSGVICMILGINKEMSNIQCKKLIRNTAIDLKMEGNRQGWGKSTLKKWLIFVRNKKAGEFVYFSTVISYNLVE